jgi:hypothetical protein
MTTSQIPAAHAAPGVDADEVGRHKPTEESSP